MKSKVSFKLFLQLLVRGFQSCVLLFTDNYLVPQRVNVVKVATDNLPLLVYFIVRIAYFFTSLELLYSVSFLPQFFSESLNF